MNKLIFLIYACTLLTFPLSGQNTPVSSPLQGGDNVATAIVINGPLPFYSIGTTAGYEDDYDEACPYEGSTAPDVVYAFAPAADVTVNIDLCGSSFDTKIYVYENIVASGIPFDCNDDYYADDSCGYYVSKIENLALFSGNTYYIVIDGFDEFAFGNYELSVIDVSPPPACTWGVDILCPAGAETESETCGANNNGGCDMAPGLEIMEYIPASGLIFCGTLWAESGTRDKDWFELILAEPSLVILTADAEEMIHYGLVDGGTGGYLGNPDCASVTGINPAGTAGPCEESTLDLGLLNAGTYWFTVALTADDGLPCSNHYWIDFTVVPQPCPAPVDLAASNISSSSATLTWTEPGTATNWEYQVGPAGFTPAPTGTSVNQNAVELSGLSPGSSYDFYVRSSCDPSYSEWEGPFGFTTLCGTVEAIPWSEGFEGSWPPACWADSEQADFGWSQSTLGEANNGSEWGYCNLEGSILTTPAINLSAPSLLTFWFRVENAAFPQSFSVMTGNDTLYHVNGASNENYKPVQVSLTDYTGQIIPFAFVSHTGYGAADFGLCLDDVSVSSFHIWTGNSNAAWNNSANWSPGSIPGPADAILIPSVPEGSNFPVISGAYMAECDFIALQPGATITIVAGSSLEIANP